MILFHQDLESVETAPGVFSATVSDNWSVNGIPNGGYLMAMIVDVLAKRSSNIKIPIVTANYILRCVPGPAEIQIEEISRTKNFHRFEAKLIQNGKERVRALATFALENHKSNLDRYEATATSLAAREECISMPAFPKFTLFDQLDLRLDPTCAGWMVNQLADVSESKGWIKFRDDQPYDTQSLLLIADSLPPAIMTTQGMQSWVPTIELSVNIRNLPQTEWLNCSLRTRFVSHGILEADGEIWDESGQLIAISRQIAQIRKR